MSKAKPPRRKARPSNTRPPAPRNAQLGAQTRRILEQHYRAKHGVK